MNDQKRARARKARAKQKRFAKRAVIGSIVVCALFCALIAVGVHEFPGYIDREIERALNEKNYARAESLAEYLFNEEQADEVSRKTDYLRAGDQYAAGNFDAARAMYALMGNYSDAPDKVRACDYQNAYALYSQKQYEAAAELFLAASGYEDALVMADRCRYAIAQACYVNGDITEAIERFDALGDFEDAKARKYKIAMDITGETDGEKALKMLSGLSDEQMEYQRRLNAARDSIRRGVLDTGFIHSVALTSSGRVLAAGSNQYGQKNVSDWNQIVMVCAGAYHTVGLKSDGTVVAVGRNDEGQCDVSGWTNVVQIAATDYDTLALKSDGTVLSCGFHDYTVLSSWAGVTDIEGGSYMAACLYGNGKMLSTSAASLIHSDSPLSEIDVSSGYAVGITRDGAIVSTTQIPTWENVVAVSAGTTGVLAIDMDGNVRSYFFRDTDVFDFTDDTAAIGIVAGGGHHLVLRADGTVEGYGDNEYGQCDVNDWRLF